MGRREDVDPSIATVGVFNRVQYIPKQASSSRPAPISAPSASLAGLGDDEEDDYWFQKEGSENFEAGGEYSPENVEWPIFPDPGGSRPEDVQRRSSSDVDLKTHGAHEYPKPSAREIIKARLANHRLHLPHNAEEEIKAEADKRKASRDATVNAPTEIRVDRREIDIDRSGTITKQSSSILSLLEEADANPVKIMLVLDQKWGTEWKGWEPETITQMIKDEGVEVSKVNLDKIMAIKVLVNTGEFWSNPRTFEKVCLAFSSRMVDWGVVQEPRVHEIAACVALIERYIAEDTFSDTVAAYVAGAAVRDGYVLLPPSLSFAEFPFYSELAMTMGDEVLDVQRELMEALSNDGVDPPDDHVVQYMRILRCQYHAQDMIDGAKS